MALALDYLRMDGNRQFDFLTFCQAVGGLDSGSAQAEVKGRGDPRPGIDVAEIEDGVRGLHSWMASSLNHGFGPPIASPLKQCWP